MEKSSWVIPRVVAVSYESFSLQSFKSQFKWGFTKLVVTRAGRLMRIVASRALTFLTSLFHRSLNNNIITGFLLGIVNLWLFHDQAYKHN